jgi:protease-4
MNPSESQNNQSNLISPAPKKSRKRFFFLACSALVLIFVCSCGGFLLLSSPNSGLSFEEGNTDPSVTITETKTMELGNKTALSSSKIAVVDVSGAINYSTQSEALPNGSSNRTVVAQIQKAANLSEVKVIVVRFNTPGGAVSAAEPICKAMKKANETKPVYAFIDTEGASLGYLLPNCAKSIYARPDAITGSIGVRADLQDLSGILTNLGAKQTTITNTNGTQKTQSGLFDKNSDEYKQFQKLLDEAYDYFLTRVWEGRKAQNNGLTYEKLRSLADGRIFSGKQAKEQGLVDEVAYYDEVIDSIIKKENLQDDKQTKKIEVIEYAVEADFFSSLFGASATFLNVVNGHSVQTEKVKLMMME